MFINNSGLRLYSIVVNMRTKPKPSRNSGHLTLFFFWMLCLRNFESHGSDASHPNRIKSLLKAVEFTGSEVDGHCAETVQSTLGTAFNDSTLVASH
jgi:hypothetical protein